MPAVVVLMVVVMIIVMTCCCSGLMFELWGATPLHSCLGYNEADDTSLVECRPHTGRTHQLRLHLQLLGNPIANDPCYGGVLSCLPS